MPPNSSDSTAEELKALKEAVRASACVHWSNRLWMLLINFIPLLHVLAIVLLLLLPYAGWLARVGAAVVCLYLMSPLLARLILFVSAISERRIALGTRSFFAWWTLFQLQIVFCRFPVLEEALRLVPGLYSQWLRLWGAQIGRFTYWSPGTLITDRSFLSIGDDVIFGAGVRLNPHVLAPDKTGRLELVLATVKVGNRAVVGGYSLLTAGTEISPDELTRAFLVSPPFSIWKNGKRIRHENSPEIE